MKPKPKCSLFNPLSSDMVTNVALVKVCVLPSTHSSLFIGLYVCMLPTFLKNYCTELHEIFRDDLSSSKDQLIRFCSDQVKGQGEGHEKVKNIFLSL